MKKILLVNVLLLSISFSMLGQKKWSETPKGNFTQIDNKGGLTLGYSPKSGVKILTIDGFAFKDLNKNGALDVYEDWRKPVAERAKDLASKMTVDQMAGLMLYSRHQSVPAPAGGYFGGTYNGKPFPESGAQAADLSDQQKAFLTTDNLRHVLMTSVENPTVSALWNNNVQELEIGRAHV